MKKRKWYKIIKNYEKFMCLLLHFSTLHKNQLKNEIKKNGNLEINFLKWNKENGKTEMQNKRLSKIIYKKSKNFNYTILNMQIWILPLKKSNEIYFTIHIL